MTLFRNDVSILFYGVELIYDIIIIFCFDLNNYYVIEGMGKNVEEKLYMDCDKLFLFLIFDYKGDWFIICGLNIKGFLVGGMNEDEIIIICLLIIIRVSGL